MNGTTTRRLATGALALGLILAGSATAAAGGLRGGRHAMPGPGLRAALETLDLTDVQKEKVKQYFEAEKGKREAARAERVAAREALRTSAGAANPDPAAVGEAFLRLRAHRESMKAERRASRERLEAILTAEQKAKLEGWLSAHRQMRRGRSLAGDRPFGRRGPRPALD